MEFIGLKRISENNKRKEKNMSADSCIETVLETLYDAKSQLSDEDFETVLDEVRAEMEKM